MQVLILACLVGATIAYPKTSGQSPSVREAQRKQSSGETDASSLEDFYDNYDDSNEQYHGDDDGHSEYDDEEGRSKSADPPKWTGPLAQPPSYDSNGAPHPVQDLPEVVAERQKHLRLFSFGPHAGAVAAQPWVKPVPGGYSSPWVPLIVPVTAHHHPSLQQQHQFNHIQQQQYNLPLPYTNHNNY